MTRKCTKCKLVKALAEFGPHKATRLRVASWCKACCKARRIERERADPDATRAKNHRNYNRYGKNSHLRRAYGIGLDEKMERLRLQGNVCSICETAEPGAKGFVVDHNHTTERVRAILCSPCNFALGCARERPDLLERMASYLTIWAFIDQCEAKAQAVVAA